MVSEKCTTNFQIPAEAIAPRPTVMAPASCCGDYTSGVVEEIESQSWFSALLGAIIPVGDYSDAREFLLFHHRLRLLLRQAVVERLAEQPPCLFEITAIVGTNQVAGEATGKRVVNGWIDHLECPGEKVPVRE